jgi:hypothetical protein
MTTSEFATRTSIWIALLCYFAATLTRLRNQPVNASIPRWLWTAGCAAYVIHVACAFQFYHHWSHAAALEDTARQTADVTGWKWGGGIWFNYLFTFAWAADVVRLWRNNAPPPSGPMRALNEGWQTFFFFMVFNATVVFESGLVRWLGAIGCLAIVSQFLRSRRKLDQAKTAV